VLIDHNPTLAWRGGGHPSRPASGLGTYHFGCDIYTSCEPCECARAICGSDRPRLPTPNAADTPPNLMPLDGLTATTSSVTLSASGARRHNSSVGRSLRLHQGVGRLRHRVPGYHPTAELRKESRPAHVPLIRKAPHHPIDPAHGSTPFSQTFYRGRTRIKAIGPRPRPKAPPRINGRVPARHARPSNRAPASG